MRRRKLAGLFLCATLTLTGCTGPEPAATPSPDPTAAPSTPAPTAAAVPQTVEFALPYYAGGGFHPITGVNQTNLNLSPLLYEGLFAVDKTFQAQRVLCSEETVSEDGLTWTFRLRDAQFSDGSPVTASQVAASLQTARTSTSYAGRLADVRSVIAGMDGAVVVNLARPNGALPLLLDIPVVKETGDASCPLGSGPYVLEDNGESLSLVAKEGSNVPLPSIPLRAVEGVEDLSYAFETKAISMVSTDLTGANSLAWSGRYEITDYTTNTLLYLGCNLKEGVCGYPEVRRALGRTIDRENITGTILSSHAKAATLPVHPDSAIWDAALSDTLTRSVEQAEEDLTAAGWRRGEDGIFLKNRIPLELRLLVNRENSYKVNIAEALATSFQALGCTVTVEKLPWEDFVTALEEGEFDLYLGETTLTADFDLESLIGAEGQLNYGSYEDEETETLLENLRPLRMEERAGAVSALCTHLAEGAPILPICFKNWSLLTQWGQIRGLNPVQRNVFYGIESWSVEKNF